MTAKDISRKFIEGQGGALGFLLGGPEGAEIGYELAKEILDEYGDLSIYDLKQKNKQDLMNNLHNDMQKLLEKRLKETLKKNNNKNKNKMLYQEIYTAPPPIAPIIPPYYLSSYGFHEHYAPEYPEIGIKFGKPIDIAHPPLTKQPNATMPPAGGFRNHIGFIERRERVSGFSGRIIGE